jgi:hypothetical protein
VRVAERVALVVFVAMRLPETVSDRDAVRDDETLLLIDGESERLLETDGERDDETVALSVRLCERETEGDEDRLTDTDAVHDRETLADDVLERLAVPDVLREALLDVLDVATGEKLREAEADLVRDGEVDVLPVTEREREMELVIDIVRVFDGDTDADFVRLAVIDGETVFD